MSNNIENLFTQYYQILRAYALRYVQNQDAAEDIVQDVFFELWLRRNEIDFDLPMKAYLFKSVLNKSRNYIYDKRVKDKISFDSDNDIQFIDDYLQSFVVYQEDSLLLKDLDREIKTYVESLPEQCHRIFIMSRSLNLKNKDIALRLGISIKTVEKQITKALSGLRNHLKEKGLFLLDCFNPNIQYIVENEREQHVIAEYTTKDKRRVLIKQSMHYENASQINRIKWQYFIDNKFHSVQNMDMRLFFPQELDSYLKQIGFNIIHKFGDFTEGEFDDNSEKQIYILELKK